MTGIQCTRKGGGGVRGEEGILITLIVENITFRFHCTIVVRRERNHSIHEYMRILFDVIATTMYVCALLNCWV